MKEDLKASEITEVAKEVVAVNSQQGTLPTPGGQASNVVTETVKYQDGSSATGPAPLPKRSPEEQAAGNPAPGGGTALTQAELQAMADQRVRYQQKARKSAVARFNEEPFIVAVRALLLKIDLEPKIGWNVEWQAVRRELKALEESME